MGLLDTLFAGGMQGNPEPDPQEAMLADLFRKLQASQHVQTQGVVNPGSTPAPDTGRVGMFSPSSAAASSAQLPPAVPPLQERPVQDAPQPGVPYAAPPQGMVPQDIAAKMPPTPSQAMQRPAAPPQREANVWDHLGRLSRGYNSGGLVGGVADMMNTGRDQADTNQTIAALGQQLGDPQMARMIMQDPELRKSVVPLLFKQKLGLGDVPSNVQEWKYYNGLSEKEKQDYLTMKRAQKFYDTGLQHVQPNAVNPGGPPVATIAKDPAGVARERKVGEGLGESIVGLPRAIEKATEAIGLIDRIAKHPGRETGTGLSSKLDPRNYIAGTDAADFGIMNKQLVGKTFLEAFESLKGGGAITQVEGEKATDAIARLNVAQSDEAYLEALNDLKAVITRGMAVARQKAGQSGPAPAAPPESPAPTQAAGGELPRPKTTQEAAALPKGTRFIGPDGVERIRP